MISRRDEENSSPGPYSILIGALLCVAQCTRADISFAVNWLLQFLRDPWESHCFATLRVLNYLITTKKIQLQLGGGHLKLSGYLDSDWAEDRETRWLMSAYIYRVGLGPISLKSWKQATVSLSSTKAEYKALSDSCKEALWLENLMTELCLQPNYAIPVYVDNEGG